jgi:hypothetical protein
MEVETTVNNLIVTLLKWGISVMPYLGIRLSLPALRDPTSVMLHDDAHINCSVLVSATYRREGILSDP